MQMIKEPQISLIYSKVIDAASNFNMAVSAMNDLTHDQTTSLGWVPVTAVDVAPSVCEL
jgi:Cerato-platanin